MAPVGAAAAVPDGWNDGDGLGEEVVWGDGGAAAARIERGSGVMP